jgi:hypothetical protein
MLAHQRVVYSHILALWHVSPRAAQLYEYHRSAHQGGKQDGAMRSRSGRPARAAGRRRPPHRRHRRPRALARFWPLAALLSQFIKEWRLDGGRSLDYL